MEVINYLLETLEDVTVDEVDIENQTALYHASAGGHLEAVKRLVDVGGDTNARDKVIIKLTSFRFN